MNSLRHNAPPPVFNLHYGQASFAVLRVRHWSPTQSMSNCYKIWEQKIPLPPPLPPGPKRRTWHSVANGIRDQETNRGYGPGSQFFILDHIPGPCYLELHPGQPERRVNERDIYRQSSPGEGWEAIFNQREKETLAKDDLEMAVGGDGI